MTNQRQPIDSTFSYKKYKADDLRAGQANFNAALEQDHLKQDRNSTLFVLRDQKKKVQSSSHGPTRNTSITRLPQNKIQMVPRMREEKEEDGKPDSRMRVQRVQPYPESQKSQMSDSNINRRQPQHFGTQG